MRIRIAGALSDAAGRKAVPRPGRRGFTLLELLVTVAIIAVLLTLVGLVAVKLREGATATNCVSNLVNLRMALQSYANDHSGRYPDPTASETPWETTVAKYIASPALLQCPADKEVFPAVGSSYDWRDTSDANTTLAGRLASEARPDAVLVFEALPGWHQKGTMNAVLTNGSALTMEQEQCLSDLQRSPLRR
jgi:prepilin-type N-terminal cleavage/methylation domain-containing protein